MCIGVQKTEVITENFTHYLDSEMRMGQSMPKYLLKCICSSAISAQVTSSVKMMKPQYVTLEHMFWAVNTLKLWDAIHGEY